MCNFVPLPKSYGDYFLLVAEGDVYLRPIPVTYTIDGLIINELAEFKMAHEQNWKLGRLKGKKYFLVQLLHHEPQPSCNDCQSSPFELGESHLFIEILFDHEEGYNSCFKFEWIPTAYKNVGNHLVDAHCQNEILKELVDRPGEAGCKFGYDQYIRALD